MKHLPYQETMLNNMKCNLIYLVSCMDIFAVSLIVPLFTQFLNSIEFSNTTIGLINSVYSGIQFFASPFIGHMSDIYGSKNVLIVTLLVCSLFYPLLGMTVSVAVISFVRLLIGIVKHTQLLCKNYIEDSMDEKEHIKNFGKLSGFTALGFIVGPIIGGYIIDLHNGFTYMCCVTGFLFGVNAIFAYYLPYSKKTKKKKIITNRNFFNGFKNIPWSIVWDLFLLKSVSVFAVYSFYLNYNLSLRHRYDVSSILIGYSYSLQGIIRSSTSFTVHYILKLFPNNTVILTKIQIMYIILIISFVALYFAPNFYIYVLVLIPFNICLTFIRILNHEALIERTEDRNKGIILGAFGNVNAICRFILPLLTGYIVDKFDYDVVYIISILSLTIGILIISYCSRKRYLKLD